MNTTKTPQTVTYIGLGNMVTTDLGYGLGEGTYMVTGTNPLEGWVEVTWGGLPEWNQTGRHYARVDMENVTAVNGEPVSAPAVEPVKPFVDGTHKWGGRIYAVNARDFHGRYTRVTLGVVKKMPATWTDLHPEQQYLLNDWTRPARDADGNHREPEYFPTRKAAMAALQTVAERALTIAATR